MKNVRGRKKAVAQAEYLARLEYLARADGVAIATGTANKLYYRGLTPTDALRVASNTRAAVISRTPVELRGVVVGTILQRSGHATCVYMAHEHKTQPHFEPSIAAMQRWLEGPGLWQIEYETALRGYDHVDAVDIEEGARYYSDSMTPEQAAHHHFATVLQPDHYL